MVQFYLDEDFSKNNSLPIHKFIFNHYSKEMNDNPSSRAIFEKQLRKEALPDAKSFQQGLPQGCGPKSICLINRQGQGQLELNF